METKEYFEKVMRDYAQNKNGRSLRKYCQDEGVDYNWMMRYKRSMPASAERQKETEAFVPLTLTEGHDGEDETIEGKTSGWGIVNLTLRSPQGAVLEMRSNNLHAVSELLLKLTGQP